MELSMSKQNEVNATIEQKLADAVNEASVTLKVNLIQNLSVEQRSALEQKFLSLPQEVRLTVSEKFPSLDNTERYILRQMIKEANNKLASNLRPGWYSTLQQRAKDLLSSSEEVRKYAGKKLAELAEEFDSKEAATLIKKYKNQSDRTTEDEHIIQVCNIFGLESKSIK